MAPENTSLLQAQSKSEQASALSRAWEGFEDALASWEHYPEKRFKDTIDAFDELLKGTPVEEIIADSALEQELIPFLLQRKQNCTLSCEVGPQSLTLTADGCKVYEEDRVEMVIQRTIPSQDSLAIVGYLKSPVFLFCDKPTLHAHVLDSNASGEPRQEEVQLYPSSHDYNFEHIKTNRCWDFSIKLTCTGEAQATFSVVINGHTYPTRYTFTERAGFSNEKPQRERFSYQGATFEVQGDTLSVRSAHGTRSGSLPRLKTNNQLIEPRRMLVRALAKRIISSNRTIWLYYDCKGVEKNNAYYQFMHDLGKNDGVERYYVVNDPLETKVHLFTPEQMKSVIPFGSRDHKLLFLAARKVITAYVEEHNWIPFLLSDFKYYADLFTADLVYLQHGILHATMPWKYSLDRVLVDKEVISSHFEHTNFTTHYGFDDAHLICAGMPRYDIMDAAAPSQQKILYAPSWRQYLASNNFDSTWSPLPELFEQSSFYQEIRAFIDSPRLQELLEKEDFTLEIKMHPIFTKIYSHYFQSSNPRITIAQDVVREEDYRIFITDFSSYRFDFVYLKRALIYFMPDEAEYQAGLCALRQTDLPLEGMFGDMARTAEQLIDLLTDCIERGGQTKEDYAQQMNDFFFYYDNNQCQRIYEALKG